MGRSSGTAVPSERVPEPDFQPPPPSCSFNFVLRHSVTPLGFYRIFFTPLNCARWKHRSGLIARNHIVVSCWSGCTGQHKLGHRLFPMRQSFAETISRFARSRHLSALRASNFNLFKCSRAFSSDFSANSMSISAWQWPCALATQPPPT